MAKKKIRDISTVEEALKELTEGLTRVAYSPDVNSYEPHNKQKVFHSSNKKTRLYIGGNRSGKTTGGIVEDVWWLTHKHPYLQTPDRPVAGRIVSVDFANGVNKIIIPQLKQWVPPSQLRGGSWYSAYESMERTLHFENGSFVELMSYDQDLDKFAGTSRDFIHYDEEPPEDIRIENLARLIDRKGREWFTLTPVEGMAWIFDQLYEPGLGGLNPLIDVIEVGMEENPHLDQDEVNEFLDKLSPEERKIRGQGKFVVRGGLVYKKFSVPTHVIDPIDPKQYLSPKYSWYMSLDHGFNNPTAVLWHIVDTSGRVITFAEHYEAEQTIDYHAEVIKTRDKMHGRIPGLRVCDPALAQRNPLTGTSIQTEYAIRGIGMALGNNDVLTGVAKVNQYLDFTADGKPNWLITANCANLINEIKKLRWKTWASRKQQAENNPYDQIHKKNDHACDSARYLFSFLPELKPIPKLPTKSVELPKIGGNSAKSATAPNVDPNLVRGSRKKTVWDNVVLNDEDF